MLKSMVLKLGFCIHSHGVGPSTVPHSFRCPFVATSLVCIPLKAVQRKPCLLPSASVSWSHYSDLTNTWIWQTCKGKQTSPERFRKAVFIAFFSLPKEWKTKECRKFSYAVFIYTSCCLLDGGRQGESRQHTNAKWSGGTYSLPTGDLGCWLQTFLSRFKENLLL